MGKSVSGAPGRRARRSRSEWEQEVEQWRRSGKSAAEYARLRGLHAGTLATWASKLRGTEASGRAEPEPKFLPLRVTGVQAPIGDEVAKGEVEVVLGNGRRVCIRGEVSPQMVARVLDAAEGGRGC